MDFCSWTYDIDLDIRAPFINGERSLKPAK